MILTALILLPLPAAFLCYFSGRFNPRMRNLIAVLTTGLEFVLTVILASESCFRISVPGILGTGLSFCTDGFRKVYCVLIAFAWLMTALFGTEYFRNAENSPRYFFFNLLTLGATLGVFLSADLFTALVFFEIMSFTSYTWVIQEETPEAVRAANTYLAVAVIGGLTSLMGIYLLQTMFGTTDIAVLAVLAQNCPNRSALYAAGICVLFGFGAKAGMFPLHIWLPKAHPVAPAPASALLSGVLTKSGIFGVIAISCQMFSGDKAWGTALLILGTVTMLLGALLALFSVNLKRTLACSSVSQIGFILVGISMVTLLGPDSALAARGTVMHMINHTLFKLVLFLCAGAVYMNTHALDLNRIRGYGRHKPFLMIVFLIGALGISGFPLFSGYISKTLLHESILEYTAVIASTGSGTLWLTATEWLFLLSGGFTVAYMTKLFVAVFVEKNPDAELQKGYDSEKSCVGLLGKTAIAFPAVLIPVLGIFAGRLFDPVADLCAGFFSAGIPESVQYFSAENLKGSLISVGLGALLYFLAVRIRMIRWDRSGKQSQYIDRWPERLDLENLLYRPLLLSWLPALLGSVSELFGENRLTGKAALALRKAGEAAAYAFGENVLTQRIALALRKTGDVIAHAFSDSLDALILLLRRTVYKDTADLPDPGYAFRAGQRLDAMLAHRGHSRKHSRKYAMLFPRIQKTLRKTHLDLSANLSFALIMFILATVMICLYVLF